MTQRAARSKRYVRVDERPTEVGATLNERVGNLETTIRFMDDELHSITDEQLPAIRRDMVRGFADVQTTLQTRAKDSVDAQRMRWGTLVGLTGVFGLLLTTGFGVFWMMIQMQVQNRTGPIEKDLSNTTVAANAARDALQGVQRDVMGLLESAATSRESRKHLEDMQLEQSKQLTTLLADQAANKAATRAKIAEIETQFHWDRENRNIQFSDQQRTNSAVWNAASDLGAKLPHYPTGPFYQPQGSKGDGEW